MSTGSRYSSLKRAIAMCSLAKKKGPSEDPRLPIVGVS